MTNNRPVQSLIIAPQWIGDAVMTEPLLRRLAARGEVLTVAALPWVAPVYRAMPQVQRVETVPFAHGGLQWAARKQTARAWRGQFQRAYVLPNSLKSAIAPLLARIPQRIGYLGEARWGLLTQRLPNPDKKHRPPMVAHYSALSGTARSVHDSAERPQLRVDTALRAQTLAQWHLQAGAFATLVPGAEYGSAKRWPEAHFSALARTLAPLPLVLLGSAKDHALCTHIAQQGGPHVQVLAGKTSLDEAIALISAARFQVGNDSGLMHIAAALDTPQVALFGSSSPHHTPPLSPAAHVVWLKDDPHYQPPLDCAPCFARECPLAHRRCLQDISPARVAALLPQPHA